MSLNSRSFFPILLILGLIVTATLSAADPQPQQERVNPIGVVYQSLQLVGQGKGAQANEKMASIRDQLDDSPNAYSARQLEAMLSGKVWQQQSYWANRQVVSRVVLVQNDAEFLKAIQQWEADKFWPVLYEDSWFTTLFIEAFEPNDILRFAPTASNEHQADEALTKSIEQHNKAIAQSKQPVPGMVLIDPASDLKWAGLALAAGRGQPIAEWEMEKRYSDVADWPLAEKLAREVAGLIQKQFGKDAFPVIGLTLAGDYPYRYLRPGKTNQRDADALDDLLGRDGQKRRLAYVGRLLGSKEQAVYQAMASMFLQPKNALLYNTYLTKGQGGSFGSFHMDLAEVWLKRHMKVIAPDAQVIQRDHWLSLTNFGQSFDFYMINSAGGWAQWTIRWPRERGSTEDMPIGRASAVHMVHSYSLQSPHSTRSVGGRFIAGGAYWYYGSMNEPTLGAFVTPTRLATLASSGTPLVMAARYLPIESTGPAWRLMLIGDPLFVIRPEPAKRIEGNKLPGMVSVITTQPKTIGERLKLATWSGKIKEANLLAVQLLKQEPDGNREDYGLAALLQLRQGQSDWAVNLSAKDLRFTSSSTKLTLADGIRREGTRALAANNFAAVEKLIMHTCWLGDGSDLRYLASRYIDEMKKAGRIEQARQFIASLAQREDLHISRRRALNNLLNDN